MPSTNPFRPNASKMPPHLAGREALTARFAEMVRRLLDGGDDGTGVVFMQGPRGNGKTALLHHFESLTHAVCRDAGLDPGECLVVSRRSVALGSRLSAATLLAPLLDTRLLEDGHLTSRTGEVRVDGHVGIPGLASIGISATEGASDEASENHLANALASASRERPRLLLLDEAHALDVGVLGTLLNTIQDANNPDPSRGAGGRVLAVLTGTPGLLSAAREAASFSERYPVFSVGLLDERAAVEALSVPLAAADIRAEPGVLERVAEDAQRYPYFLQLWGRELWNVAHEAAERRGEVVIDEAVRARAEGAVEGERLYFYEGRYDEIAKSNLWHAAVAVARCYAEVVSRGGSREGSREGSAMSASLHPVALTNAIKEALDDGGLDEGQRLSRARELLQQLVDRGFVWHDKASARNRCLPGIPSLMAYTLETGKLESSHEGCEEPRPVWRTAAVR